MNTLFRAAVVSLGCLAAAACANIKLSGPAPTASATAPQVFVVFFDGANANLTADGKDIVDHAAAAAKADSGKMVQITGPTTKIVPGYDPRFAEPRMRAVEERLVADGVSKERFVQTSLPTAKLMVDLTGARRVEIRLVDKPSA